jgi:hypothetical protein
MSRQKLLTSLRKTVLYGIRIVTFYLNWTAAVSSHFLADLNLNLSLFVCFQTKQVNVGCFSNIFLYNILQSDVSLNISYRTEHEQYPLSVNL